MKRLPDLPAKVIAAAFIMIAAVSPSSAQEKTLHVELNNATQASEGCRLSFLFRSGLEVDIEELKFEVVLFDKDLRVAQILLLDAGRLRSGKTRVTQFDVEQQTCGGISSVLLNDVTACKSANLDASRCLDLISPASRTDIPFKL